MILKKCTACGKFYRYCSASKCPECRAKSAQIKRSRDKIYNSRIRDRETDKFYHSAAWKRLSKVVLARAGYKCALCGGLATEVHHIEDVRTAPGKRLDPSNLTALCTSCHNKQRT